MVNIKVKKQKGINKVKQKVNQKVNQKVVVNVGEVKRRTRKAPKRNSEAKKAEATVQQAMPRTFYQQPNADASNLVALLMKNLTKPEVKADVRPRNELERTREPPPAVEPPVPAPVPLALRAIVGAKAEERRGADLGGSSEFLPVAPSLSEFKGKFKNKRDQEAEQRALDFIRALERPAEQPLQRLHQSSLLSEVRADPEVKSLGARLKTEEHHAAQWLEEAFDDSIPEAVQSLKVKGEGPKASAYSATPATQTRPFNSALNFVDANKSTTFDALPPARLARPEEQGESLASALLNEAVDEVDLQNAFATGGGGGGGGTEEIEDPQVAGEAIDAIVEEEAPPPALLRGAAELSTTDELFNPPREESLAEQVGRKYTQAEFEELKAIARANGVKLTGIYTTKAGNESSGTLGYDVLRRKILDKGVELPPNLLEPSIFSNAGRKPANKG